MATPAAILSVLVEAKGIRGTARDLGKVDKAGEKAARGMSKFQKVAGVGILAVGTAAAAAGPKLISLASDAEETASKFKIVFGKETRSAIKQLDEFSKATGTSKFALREQAAQLQALIKPMGVTGKAAGKMSIGLTKLATDLASFNNSSVEEAITALQSGLVGEAEPLRRFGVQLSSVRVETFAYANGIAEQGKKLTAAQKAQASYAIILKDTKLAQGDAERTSGSYANQLKRLKSTVTDAATELGVKLLPAATAVTAGITKFLGELRSGEGIGGRVAAVFSGISNAMRGLFQGFKEGASGARDLATGLAFIGGAFVAVKVVEGLRNAIAGLTVVMTKNPIGLAAAAIGGLASAIGIMSIGVQDATADTRGFNDALRAQADALRAVRDIDIEVAQRKANVKSANVIVEASEKRLHDMRKSGKASTLELRQAEADLAQAKVGQQRANRELSRSQEDNTRKKEDAKVAADNLTKAEKDTNRSLDAAIDKNRDYIGALGRAITEQQRYGGNTKETRDNVEALRKKQKQLRDEINSLKSKKVDVSVSFKLNPAPGSSYGSQGDGWGAGAAGASVQKVAQNAVDAGKLFGPGSFGNSAIGGTGLNAFNSIASSFGLTIGSGFRPGSITSSGNVSMHALGRARDFPGSPGAMMAFAQFMAANFGGRLAELIHTPLGFSIKNGARVPPYAQADHYDHVHVAMRKGGKVPGAGVGDRVPAMLEPGEFVMRKKIVDQFGPTFFAGMNGMKKGGRVGKNTKSTMQAIANASKTSRRLGPIEQSLALSEAQGNLAAQIAAADELVRFWEGKLAIALASGRGITSAAQGLVGARSSRAGLSTSASGTDPLTAAMEENNRLLEEQNALNEQIKNNQLKVLQLATQGDQIVAAVVAAVNGGIGGRVGLGFHGIRSTPGSVANL